MKKIVDIQVKQEVLSMACSVTYCHVPDWYEGTYKDLRMNLIFPKHREAHKKQPTILWICGGAYCVVSKDVWMPEMIDFARMGYTIAGIEYRTSNSDPYPAPLMDTKAAIRFLKTYAEQFCIDPDMIFVMGESAGGTLASLAGVTGQLRELDPDDGLTVDSSVAGVIDLYGITDILKMPDSKNENLPSWVMNAFLGIYCDEKEKYIQNAAKASAINYINENTPPFLILHGDADVVVPVAQSDILYEALQAHGISSEFVVLRGAGHGEDGFYQPEVKQLIHSFIQRCINQ